MIDSKIKRERNMKKLRTKWIFCPICENKTRVKIRKNTILENFSLYCPK